MRATRAVTVAAVACVAALSGCTTATTTGQNLPAIVPTGAAMSAPSPMPAYYVVVAGLKVVVRASGDGHVTGSVRVPVAAEIGRDSALAQVFGGLDDRHFVILVSLGGDLPGVADDTVYLLTVSPDGRPGRLRRLPFDSAGVPVTGAALAPDSRMLVLSLTYEFPPDGPVSGKVELLNVQTGAIRTWTARTAPGYWPGVPAWAGNGTVLIPWWHSVSQGTSPADLAGVRALDVAAPGRSLLEAPLVAFDAPVPGLESAVITPGGLDVIASSCRTGHHAATAQVIELSAADGWLAQVLRTQTARFGNDEDAQGAILSTCQVLSVADGGNHVLVQALAFGRIDNGAFTSLPGTPPDEESASAAW